MDPHSWFRPGDPYAEGGGWTLAHASHLQGNKKKKAQGASHRASHPLRRKRAKRGAVAVRRPSTRKRRISRAVVSASASSSCPSKPMAVINLVSDDEPASPGDQSRDSDLAHDESSEEGTCFGDRPFFAVEHLFLGAEWILGRTIVRYRPTSLEIETEDHSRKICIPYADIGAYDIQKEKEPFFVSLSLRKPQPGLDEVRPDDSDKRKRRITLLFFVPRGGGGYAATKYAQTQQRIENNYTIIRRMRRYVRCGEIKGMGLLPQRIAKVRKFKSNASKNPASRGGARNGNARKDDAKTRNKNPQHLALVEYCPPGGVYCKVTQADAHLLRDGEMLNDCIINFYTTYLMHEVIDTSSADVYAFTSFFFATYRDNDARSRFDSVRRWTKRIDIFSKDFLLVPIHHALHWKLAIVCYPGIAAALDRRKGVRPRRPRDKRRTCILYFDSLSTLGGSRSDCRLLRAYLNQELAAKHGIQDARFDRETMPSVEVRVPQQRNACDCGVFLLHYAELFCRKPFTNLAPKKVHRPQWFKTGEIRSKRRSILALLRRLSKQV